MTETITLTIAVPHGLIEEVVADAVTQAMRRITATSISGTSTSPFMTIPEAADYLRCSRQRVDDLLSSRQLTRVKEGRRTLVRRADIDAYLREQA